MRQNVLVDDYRSAHVRRTMSDENIKIVEVPFPERLPYEGGGLMASGIKGETHIEALADRLRRVEEFQRRNDYRACIPCEKCNHFIEMRGFDRNGEEKCTGYWCNFGEFETDPFHTCGTSHLARNGRKKIIYNMLNAPADFGQRPQDDVRRVYGNIGQSLVQGEKRSILEEYAGGSGMYRRADGKSVREAGGVMPKQLMN